MMESVIRLENFYFAYNKSELVLQDIDLEIKRVRSRWWPAPAARAKLLCARR